MLRGLIVRFLFGVAGLWIAARVVPGISYSNTTNLLEAALLLGVINAVLRPILVILTLPLTLITFGLFLLVINGITLWLVTRFLHGFHVHGYLAAILGALVVSVCSWIGQALVEKRSWSR
jgi:putative membrane protein